MRMICKKYYGGLNIKVDDEVEVVKKDNDFVINGVCNTSKCIIDEYFTERETINESALHYEYKKLVNTVLNKGLLQDCRNGIQLIIPHYSFILDFSDISAENHILKLRKMYYAGVIGEFKTLVSNEPLTNVSQFETNGCNYWKAWAGSDGELNLDYANMLKPQLKQLINDIKVDPNSRRHHIELWNYENVPSLSLACCWHGLTFSIIDNVLHLKWTQRSVDTMLGLPADIFLAHSFMELIASKCNLAIGTCMFSLSNIHIYKEHITNAHILCSRTANDYNNPLMFELKA